MPEIAEVARVVHYIRKYLVGKTLSKVVAADDANVYGKVGTSGAEFQKALTGRKIVGAGQQGKYFWFVMDRSPHPLMHFGMTGWLKIKGQHTYYYRKKRDGGDDDDDDDEGDGEGAGEGEEWPPRFWKYHLETKEGGGGGEKVEAAFVDSRRFARIRLVDCAAEDIRNVSPLKGNGPDPVVDKDVVTVDWLVQLCRRKKIPIKALLLDQANISGIGNWVGDEIMYHAKMHPEQYSNTLSDDQLTQLHVSIQYICGTAVELLADSDQFPEEWLFKHRWGKGKKDAPKMLPNGNKIIFLTVGGRTSAVVPSVQKKSGPVAKEVDDVEVEEAEAGQDDENKQEKGTEAKGAPARKKGKRSHEKTDEGPTSNGTARETGSAKRQRKSQIKEELTDDEAESTPRGKTKIEKTKPVKKENRETGTTNGTKKPTADKSSTKQHTKNAKEEMPSDAPEGKRRSARLSRG